MRHLQRRTQFLQEADGEIDALLLGSAESVPPLTELVGELDIPRQA
jgi:hypothetical protein